jgi:CHAT domain-containing protein
METALKQVHRPYFLHLATHGFFLANASQKWENPLLRSGLAMAGANVRKSGNDDGILTAFEVAALDLWGTKLVVLSACETGNGEVKNGEGVFGLRRALVLAGAETQVSSLWKADDLVTRKLMEKFYDNLNKGIGRAEALRKAQLEILRGGGSPAPYYWANFICIGEWKPLEK